MKKKFYGLQKRFLIYSLLLLALALLLSSIFVGIFIRKNTYKHIASMYKASQQQIGTRLSALYEQSDRISGECVINPEVQRSLGKEPLKEIEKYALSKYFAYIDLPYVDEYLYVDNKKNLYTRFYSSMNYRQFEREGFNKELKGTYGQMRWFWKEDRTFNVGEKALYIGRYVHNMEYAHKPGILILKMGNTFINQIVDFKGSDEILKKAILGIADERGNIGQIWNKGKVKINNKDIAAIKSFSKTENGKGLVANGVRINNSMVFAYRDESSGLVAFTLVPYNEILQEVKGVIFVLIGIYIIVAIVGVVLSVYISKRVTRPITKVALEMEAFNGSSFRKLPVLNTNSEVDLIGESYNKMLDTITELLEKIKNREKDLRISEINTLMSQINPHFLYNTLDTIYMLARINNEPITMKMISELSRYLRLTLSKGARIVTLEEEIENVKGYMEIIQIRNENLFTYNIKCTAPMDTPILKLILQPIVENCIKYGFSEIYTGGIINIDISKEVDIIKIIITNNGKTIEKDQYKKINNYMDISMDELRDSIHKQKNGYGLINVVSRLRLTYKDNVSLKYSPLNPQGTIIEITICGEAIRDEK